MTDTVRQEILSLHNDLRSLVARGLEPRLAGLTASEMLRLEWDEELARGAQLWADQCIFQHDNNDICRSQVISTDLEFPLTVCCRFRVGQNLYQAAVLRDPDTETGADWEAAVSGWYSEVEMFRQDPRKYDGSYRSTGHFTQLVWSRTRYLGCGYILHQGYPGHQGLDTGYYVCNYGPAGNYFGQEVYGGGETCSRCPHNTSCDTQGLCSHSLTSPTSSTSSTSSTTPVSTITNTTHDTGSGILEDFTNIDFNINTTNIFNANNPPQCDLQFIRWYLTSCTP